MKKILLLICCVAVAGLGYANKVAYQLTVNPDNAKQLIVNAVLDESADGFAGGDVVLLSNSFLNVESIENTMGSWSAVVDGVRFKGQKVYQFNSNVVTKQAISGTVELFRVTFNSARAARFVKLQNQANHLTSGVSASTIDHQLMTAGVQHTASLLNGKMVDGTAFNGVLSANNAPTPTPVAMTATSKTSVFPNPSSGELINVTIETPATEDVLVQVQSLDGKVVYELRTDLAEGTNSFELNLTTLVGGVYMLTVNGERTNHIQQLAIVK